MQATGEALKKGATMKVHCKQQSRHDSTPELLLKPMLSAVFNPGGDPLRVASIDPATKTCLSEGGFTKGHLYSPS